MNTATQNDVNIRHMRTFRDSNPNNSEGATIAYQAVDDGVKYALAYCSPKDNFSRQIGRTISTGRLNYDDSVILTNISIEVFEEVLGKIDKEYARDNMELSLLLYETISADIPATYARFITFEDADVS